jgi:hypothetical protein
MRILLVNPPHPAIGSRIPHEHLPPLGLLSIGGPLLDAGHEVQLLDAEFGPMSTQEIVERAVTFAPQAILLGHSGSTSGHPAVVQVTRALREALPAAWIVYGGVFPTYKHQVLATRHMAPWRVLLWVKFMEAVLQVRPRALWRVFAHPDRPLRDAMKWYSRIGRQVWSYEIRNFLFRDRCRSTGPTLAEFWGRPQLERTTGLQDDRDSQRGAEPVEQVTEGFRADSA